MGLTLLQESYFRLHKRISMLGLFYQYLIHHQRIVLPGLGAISIRRKPAVYDFVDHLFLPPSYSFQWDHTYTTPSPDFFQWLAGKLNMAEEEAAIKANAYMSELKKEINAGREINWEGVGIIRRGSDSSVELEAADQQFAFEKEVFGEKVVHADSSHTILVGDEERTSADMNEILGLPQRKKIAKLKLALWIAILALASVVIYLVINGWRPASVANKNTITPKDAPASYEEVK